MKGCRFAILTNRLLSIQLAPLSHRGPTLPHTPTTTTLQWPVLCCHLAGAQTSLVSQLHKDLHIFAMISISKSVYKNCDGLKMIYQL